MSTPVAPVFDRVKERRRAVALARHFRENEGLSITQTAARLGRSLSAVERKLRLIRDSWEKERKT